jgi:hypothetical protein
VNKIEQIKLKVLMQAEPDHQIDPEEDFFELGMLVMHDLIYNNLNLTPEGEKVYLEMIKEKES